MKDIYELEHITPKDLKEYCLSQIELVESGKVSRQQACYEIAGLMFRSEVDRHEQMEDVCLVAGELELPDRHVDGDIPERWKEFKDLVNALAE